MTNEHRDGITAVLDGWGAMERSRSVPEVPLAAVSRRATRRRRRRVARRLGAGLCAIALIAVAANLIALQRSADPVIGTDGPAMTGHSATVGTPVVAPITSVDDLFHLDISPSGPMPANGPITISVPEVAAGDWQNNAPHVCFDWNAALACDPMAWTSDAGGTNTGIAITWTRSMPGWVITPNGLRTCRVVHCRVLLRGLPHDLMSSNVLEVASGPRPTDTNNSIVGVRPDGAVTVSIRTMDPRRNHDPYMGASPAFALRVCAVADTTNVCDAVAPPTKVPYNTRRHRITLRSTRTIFTTEGWLDCARVACAIELRVTTAVDTNQFGPPLTKDTSVAWLPYSLARTARRLKRPTLSITPRGRYSPGTTMEATVRGHLGGAARVTLQQCALGFGNPAEVCDFGSVATTSPSADTYVAEVTLQAVSGTSVVVVRLGGEGYPPIAETGPFTVR